MLVTKGLLFLRTSRKARFFSTTLNIWNGYIESPTIPLTSPLLGHRLMGKQSFITNFEEETILELLQDISDSPVSGADVKYKEYADNSFGSTLPSVPKNITSDSINLYVQSLTNFRYPDSTRFTIEKSIFEILNSIPEMISKTTYLGIVSFFHFHSNDSKAFKVLEIMHEKAEIKQDIDFDNILLSYSNRPTDYKPRISRFEHLLNAGLKANVNTWYVTLRVLRNVDPKIQLIELMGDYGVPVLPVLGTISHSLSKFYSAEQMMSLYNKSGITMYNRMTPFLFNRLLDCYLNENRVMEAWDLMKKTHRDKKVKFKVNSGSFSCFMTYFASNNQLPYCFAFSKLFTHAFNIKTENIMINMLINKILVEYNYFDNWASVVRIVVAELKHNSKINTFIRRNSYSNLKDYAKVHGIEDFEIDKLEPEDIVLRDQIMRNLVWYKGPVLEMSKNSKEFQEISKLLGLKDNIEPVFNPTDLL